MRTKANLLLLFVACLHLQSLASSQDLAKLKRGQAIGDLKAVSLYADSDSRIIGAKFLHRSGAPVYVMQIETVPQVFMWVDTPTDSNMGIPHSLEHLLASKGSKGRYANLLKEMRFSRSTAATTDDFNFYSFSSGTGLDGFFEQFHAWLDALYQPDFSDLEAEREFYHFGVSADPKTKKIALVEKGTVYNEMQAGQGVYSYYFELNKRVLGDANPFGFYGGGVPDEMRRVTPADIRRFHAEHYRLGPTTGFIFALSSKENAIVFLQRISSELSAYLDPGRSEQASQSEIEPKYAVLPSDRKEVELCPFPSSKETDLGEVRIGWKSAKSETQTQVKLLQLFFKALADGEKSVLYKSTIDSKTREVESGATSVGASVWLNNSPFFPAEFVGFSGIPGNRLSVRLVDQLRNRVVATIAEISQYPDNSPALAAFNQSVLVYAKGWRRSQKVWIRRAPRFGLSYDTEWKEYFEYLDMDPTFVRFISEETVWKEAESQIRSGRNIWKELIHKFGLLEVPYTVASVPSPSLLGQIEESRRDRTAKKAAQLIEQFGAGEQQAFTLFAQQEAEKAAEIDKIADRVRRPTFSAHPPLTPDDDIQYRQFHIGTVPVVASFFDRAPTIDLGLSFDLHRIPRKYYKYLPILPRSLDSLGLKSPHGITPYADLLAETQTKIDDFAIRYDINPVSHRADLTLRASMTDLPEFRTGLKLIEQMMAFNNLEPSNADRLRDIVEKRLRQEDAYDAGGNDYPYMSLGYAFRYQSDVLYVGLASVFTRAHWDGRLLWLLHQPVSPKEIADLGNFAEHILPSFSGMSAADISQQIKSSNADGLERELLDYWGRNIPAFPEAGLTEGLKHLTREVQEDLRTGPDKARSDLRELQRLVLTQNALHIDLTLDPSDIEGVKAALTDFLTSLAAQPLRHQESYRTEAQRDSILENLKERYNSPTEEFPIFVGLADPRSATANMVFFADCPGYGQLDHGSLVEILSAKLLSGSGPHSFFSKAFQDGLAYSNGITCDPGQRLMRYFAERSPDITSLIQLANSTAITTAGLHDSSLIDYSLQRSFPPPRSMATFSERGAGLAQDIRNGNEPAAVRRFSKALLSLRKEPNLLEEITGKVLDSIGPVLVSAQFAQQQRRAKALFFFVGPERLLADAEKRLSIPRLLRLYPSDYWIDDVSPSSKTLNIKARGLPRARGIPSHGVPQAQNPLVPINPTMGVAIGSHSTGQQNSR